MFSIERTGTFTIVPNGKIHRCGESDTRSYNYHVKADVTGLCPDGWVLDNREIPRIVDRIASMNLASCESLCDAICQAIVRAMNGRAYGVTVAIEGIRDSWIRVHWGSHSAIS